MIIFTLFPWICGIFGLIVGSFLNVVIIRAEQEKSLGGRSECVTCHKTLHWYELIPVVSFLVQRGKCRSCKTKISPQYMLVELLTAIMFFVAGKYIFALFWLPFSVLFWIGLVLLFIVFSLIIVMSVYDIRTRQVPVRWIGYLFIASILFLGVYYASYYNLNWIAFVPHISGMLIVVPFLALYLFSSGRLIGFADIEIIAWIGMMLGIVSGLSATIVSFYLGAVFAIGFVLYHLIIKKNQYRNIRKKRIAFVPFLFSGWMITMLTSFSIIDLFVSLFL